MKLTDFNRKADEYTAKASEIVRQLILGGLAIIWLFKTSFDGKETLDGFLVLPLITLSFALISDLMQYVVAGKIWKAFFRRKEKEIAKQHKTGSLTEFDPEIKAPNSLNRPIYFFYWTKITAMIISYFFIFIYLVGKVNLN